MTKRLPAAMMQRSPEFSNAEIAGHLVRWPRTQMHVCLAQCECSVDPCVKKAIALARGIHFQLTFDA
jgi:hypothetical protein